MNFRKRSDISEMREEIRISGEEWQRMRVLPKESDNRVIVGRLTDIYNIREIYEKARQKKDPYLSPHGFFRKLVNGNRGHAVEFLEKFGPLFRSGRRIVGVNLAHFWAAHRRFCLVARLHENCDDNKVLGECLDDFLSFAGQTKDASEAHAWLISILGSEEEAQAELKTRCAKYPNARNFGELFEAEELDRARNADSSGEPAETSGPHSKNGPPNPTYNTSLIRGMLKHGESAREIALYILADEIERHTSRVGFSWKPGRRGDQFYRSLNYSSLWGAIWDLFAADTAGIPWRICPNDQNIFYPPRADRFYCTSEEQVAASKAKYDRDRNRRRPRRRRKKSRR